MELVLPKARAPKSNLNGFELISMTLILTSCDVMNLDTNSEMVRNTNVTRYV